MSESESSGAENTAPIVAAPEATLPEVPKAPEEQDKFGSKFAALSRKEKEIRQRETQYQSEMKRIEAEKAELSKWREEKQTAESVFQAKLKENPLKTLEELGLTYEDLTRMQLNEQNPTPEMLIKRTRQELESGYKKELEELRQSMKQKEEQEETKKHEQTVTGFKKEISNFVDANADTYELIKMNDAQETVFEVIQEYYQETGRLLSIEEAAKYTEEVLESEARKVLEAKRFKQPAKQPSEAPKTTPTLSNALSSEAPHQGEKKLTREESLARAAKMIRWVE